MPRNPATICITEHDHKRLCTVLDVALNSPTTGHRTDLRRLNEELQRAQIVRSEEIPSDVVTLNSQIVVTDLVHHEENTWLLTFPQNANLNENRLSVLSPVGTALLGAKKGEVIEWQGDSGGGKIRIKAILFQPEAAGRFDM